MNILKDGNKYFFFNSLDITKELEPKNYIFNYDEFGRMWLEEVEDFKFPQKIYNVDENLRKLIKISFNNTKRNLGVLLTGNKGQGKSLTAKLICKEQNLPVILINKSIESNINFVNFMNNIKQDYVLFVDEFEKLFVTTSSSNNEKPYHTQESFLTFMDGVLTNESKVLFLLTTNDNVNEFFINRPSRIKFMQEYSELPEELFNMIVDDKLINKEHKQDLEDNISLVNLNIDLLISILDDMNLFDMPFSSFKDHYNYKFESYKYEITTIKDGREVFDRFANLEKKIKPSWRYVAGYQVNEFVKFTKDEMIFSTTETKWDKDDNEIRETFLIKVTPSKATNYKDYAF